MRNEVSVDTNFFFNDTATTEIYTLSLHDALPISIGATHIRCGPCISMQKMALRISRRVCTLGRPGTLGAGIRVLRSEEHTSELQSRQYLVCRLLLEKKKNTKRPYMSSLLLQQPHV